MKRILFVFAIFCALQANAQNYLITFAGTGLSTTVSTVSVENLTTGATLTINGGDILHLTAIITGLNSIDDNHSQELKIYPNPMADNSILQIHPPAAGDAVITIYDMTGRKIAQFQCYLENYRQEFKLSGIKSGFYIINVKGSSYQFSGKLLSNRNSNGPASIVKLNNNIQAVDEKPAKKAKGTQASVDMPYTFGDRLKFTGISGIYSTVMTDIPESDKTITFDFISCTDGDDNNYPVVQIGTQLCMAENLKTTKFNDNTSIPLVTDNTAWAALITPGYCWYNNDEAAYKATYGALYNWYTLDKASNGGKNVCPTGWHVIEGEFNLEGEWTILTTYLGGEAVAGDKLKETGTTHWNSPNIATNESGYTALPGGSRNNVGDFSRVGIEGLWWTQIGYMSTTAWFHSCRNSSSTLSAVSVKITGFSVRCLKENLSTLTTKAASSIKSTTAICGGNITGGGTVTAHGVCWSISHNPTTSDNKTIISWEQIGAFTSLMTGLTAGTTYYVRAYATNGAGTAYGDERTFSTTLTVTDADGNIYNTINIGTQTWIAENLKTTKYNDGTEIPLVTDNTEWAALSAPGYCWYNNDAAANKDSYGANYNWYTVNTGKLCPTGWHVPTDGQWSILTSYLGSESIAGGKLKETGTIHWLSPNTGATDERGFTAFPGGLRTDGGTYNRIGKNGYWWSSTDNILASAWSRSMIYNLGSVERSSTLKKSGFSVRCLQGEGEEGEKFAVLTTLPLSSITKTTATCGGNVTSDGGTTITSHGVCWSTIANPTIADSKTTNGAGIGAFTSSITGLTQNTIYYVRAYATNSAGTNYGNELILKTYMGTVTDIDGNTYNTVAIGTQIWIVENLKATKYNDGTDIPLVTDNAEWGALFTPAYCWYNNDAATFKTTYGGLYNWFTVNTGKLCPAGWHVPTDSEWTTLITYLGGESVAGGKLKEAGANHWPGSNINATNETGFTALPGGFRSTDGQHFNSAGEAGGLLLATEYDATNAWYIYLFPNYSNSYIDNTFPKKYGYSIRCLQGAGLAGISTTTLSSITNNSAVSGGNVTNDGGTTVTSRGVCWSTTANPTTADNKTTDGAGTGAFTSSITGLTPNTTYYIRAYATNSIGTAYGNVISFKTYRSDAIVDIDGNFYNIVTIGTQVWMADNLKTTKYNDGTEIPLVTDYSAWAALSTPGYCWYDNDAATFKTTYGGLYNWFSINTGKLCPAGWHVPTDEQWSALTTYLGGGGVAGGKLKETGLSHWRSPNTGATNETGFSALPGGSRDEGADGSLGDHGFWWTVTEFDLAYVWTRDIFNDSYGLYSDYNPKYYGLSVRCLQD